MKIDSTPILQMETLSLWEGKRFTWPVITMRSGIKKPKTFSNIWDMSSSKFSFFILSFYECTGCLLLLLLYLTSTPHKLTYFSSTLEYAFPYILNTCNRVVFREYSRPVGQQWKAWEDLLALPSTNPKSNNCIAQGSAM